MSADSLLGTDKVAELIGVDVGTLNAWRSNGRYSLPYLKIGRSVRYRLADVMAWLEGRRVVPGPSEIADGNKPAA